MIRFLVCPALLLIVIPATLSGQDSGPGPASPATSQNYNVTTYGRSGVGQGNFVFTAPEATASGAATSGDVDATLGAVAYSGDWHAYDLGRFAIWVAQGTGDSGNFAAFGYATPEFIVGRASVSSSSSGSWLFRLFSRKSVFFYGEAAAAE